MNHTRPTNDQSTGNLSLADIATEIACVSASIVIVVILYPLFIRVSQHGKKKVSTRMIMRNVRHQWVENYTGSGPLIVNAFRDYLRASQFFANTAIMISSGVLGLVFSSPQYCLLVNSNLGTNDCTPKQRLQLVKIGVFIFNFLIAFFNFSQTVRFATHCPFILSTTHIRGKKIPYSIAQRFLERAARHWSFGIRGYYAAIPLLLWLIGPWYLLLGSICLVVLLQRVRFLGDEDFANVFDHESAETMRKFEEQVDGLHQKII